MRLRRLGFPSAQVLGLLDLRLLADEAIAIADDEDEAHE